MGSCLRRRQSSGNRCSTPLGKAPEGLRPPLRWARVRRKPGSRPGALSRSGSALEGPQHRLGVGNKGAETPRGDVDPAGRRKGPASGKGKALLCSALKRPTPKLRPQQ